MTHRFLKYWLAIFLLVFQFSASAEDTDLFVEPPTADGNLANVLILLDNTANWNNAFVNEVAALISTFNGLPVNADGSAKFRIGLMLFTESGGTNSGNDGAYVRAAVRDMTSANKLTYAALLSSLDKLGDKSNGGKLGNTMNDAYQYLAGGTPFSGNNKAKSDYAGNTFGTATSTAVYGLPNNALASMAATTYNSPGAGGGNCHNFIIYLSNGAAQDNNADTTTATNALIAAAGGGSAGTTAAQTIPLSPSGSQANVGDEWARFMKKSSLGIVTYTLDVDKVTSGQGPGWTALLQSMAKVSTGKYYDVSSTVDSGDQIRAAMADILSEIQAVNSVFAAVSLPVSVNTQGTYRNQVYVGMFRPAQYAKPRWTGNLKQYKLGYINNVLKLQDADSKSAINSNSGFITECARSFWTPSPLDTPTLDTYWSFNPQGGCVTIANSDSSNYPDGNIVEKGAQAYVLRGNTTRTVKTCSATFGSCTALTDFNNTNVTQIMLGAADTTEQNLIIDWTKGINNNVPVEYGGTIPATAMRPDTHGDVVHSRPVAINYGTDAAPQVVVFYGGNDGILRAVNGNRSEAIGTAPAGSELWAFVAPEFYGNLKRLRDNTTTINFPGNPQTSPTPLPKPYAIDGPISAYRDASHTWIYATMRRGGRVLYALDVTTPASPSLKWKIGCPNASNDTNCTSGFEGIGQTWSAPKSLTAAGYDSGNSPLLIMGGGYDGCEDTDNGTVNHNCTSSSKGNHVYVLDADSGVRLKTLDTDRGVIADLIVVPDSSGRAIHAYAADLGGNVYRVNIGTDAPANWTLTKIASLGCATTASCASNRKFMFAPDVLVDNGTYTLLLGSGDREKPLTTYTATAAVSNYFFMIKDKPSDSSWLTSESSNCGSAGICLSSLLGITTSATPSATDLAARKGWYLGLRSGEQVVTSAITIFNVVNFNTHTPAVATPGSCSSNLGKASIYNIDYNNATSTNGTSDRMEAVSGGGLPPSPTAGMVTLDNGVSVPFCIGCSPNSPLEGSIPQPPSTTIQPKARVYWYIQK